MYYDSEKYQDIFLPTDKMGRILNPTRISYLSVKEKSYLDQLTPLYQSVFKDKLHSVYIRGSLVRERFYPVYDIDCFAIISAEISEQDRLSLSNKLQSLSTEIGSTFDDSSLELSKIESDPGVGYYRSFEIKTQSVCVYGENLSSKINDFYVTEELASKLLDDIPALILKTEEKYKKSSTHAENAKICEWFMKRSIRNAYLLILAKVGRFSRDIMTCTKYLIIKYPKMEETFTSMSMLAIKPTEEKDEVLDLIDEFYRWYRIELKLFKKI